MFYAVIFVLNFNDKGFLFADTENKPSKGAMRSSSDYNRLMMRGKRKLETCTLRHLEKTRFPQQNFSLKLPTIQNVFFMTLEPSLSKVSKT